MTPRTAGLVASLERVLPLLAFAIIITAGWFWFVQPRLGAYLAARTNTAALEERARTLQQASSRSRPATPADLEQTQREFESRVPAEDRVADVAAALARAVLASAPAEQLRSLAIDTGDRVSAPRGTAADAAPAPGGGPGGSDPRLALFPYSVSYTPLRVSFDSTFETAGDVAWQLRDLPVLVEVRSATLTRGLPLMKTELVVLVLQRGAAIDVAGPPVPAAVLPPPPGPTAPRLAPSGAEPGVVR